MINSTLTHSLTLPAAHMHTGSHLRGITRIRPDENESQIYLSSFRWAESAVPDGLYCHLCQLHVPHRASKGWKRSTSPVANPAPPSSPQNHILTLPEHFQIWGTLGSLCLAPPSEKRKMPPVFLSGRQVIPAGAGQVDLCLELPGNGRAASSLPAEY